MIGSPPLMQPDHADLHWPEHHWFCAVAGAFHRQLSALDRNPAPLLEHINARKNLRLGKYFELLWLYWLQHNLRYRLLYANLPVRDQGRTLGEFDFLVEDRETGKTLHWEVAVKFYLGTGDTRQACHWWGPGRRDRLDIKTQHLLNHQSSLSRLPPAKTCLDTLGIQVDDTWALMKGRLFYPAGLDTPAPAGSFPGHQRGFWMSAQQFVQTTMPGASGWLVLSKEQWLAPLTAVPTHQIRTHKAIADSLTLTPLKRPACVIRISRGQEIERGFIVPHNWG